MAEANVIQAFQLKYNQAIYPALAESSEYSLPLQIARLEQTNAGEKVIFYNITASSTAAVLDGTLADPATAGTVEKFEATIVPFYSQRRVLKTELDKTNLDLGGDFVKSFVRAVDRGINIQFLNAIGTAKSGDLIGDNTMGPAELIDTYISSCELAAIRVSDAPDYAPKAILVMNVTDYAQLYKAIKKTSSDFSLHNAQGMFYGCKVITFNADVTPRGTSFVIPYGVVGFGYWNTVEASSEYQTLFDGLFCWAKKSGGTVVIEPDAIDVISSDPTAL